jgi:hypothetical protein
MGLASQRGEPFVQKLPQLLTRVGQERRSDPQSSEAEQQCNPAVLRRLIVEAFSDEELSVFCYDYFRKVYDQLGSGMSKIAKVQRLIEHTERNRRIDELLTRIQTANPAQYNAFEPELFGR